MGNNSLDSNTLLNKELCNPDISFWVNASAGTGKTTILVKRLLGLLVNNIDSNKILCITFTKAGAEEMKDRLNSWLAKWVFMPEEELTKTLEDLLGFPVNSNHINKARTLFAEILEENSINIQTIHSFCNNLLKNFSLETGLSPNFQLISDNDQQETIDDARNETYKLIDTDPIFKNALKAITAYSGEFSLNTILNFFAYNEEKISNILSKLTIKQIITNLYKKFHLESSEISFYENQITSTYLNLYEYIEILRSGNNVDIKLASLLASYLNSSKLQERYTQIFLTLELEPRKKLVSSEFAKKHPDILESLLREQARIKFLHDKIKEVKILEITESILIFGQIFLTYYSALKSQKESIDYNELISLTRNLLQDNSCKDWILYKLDHNIDHILLDEAQDTSPAQWNIIKSLTEDFFSGLSAKHNSRSIFIVGDEKQSIYSFQGADHQYFNEIYKYFSEKIKTSNRDFFKVNLQTSYRTSSSILTLVDKIFNQENIKDKVSKSAENIIHFCHKTNEFGIVELWPLITPKEESENTKLNDQLTIQIAKKIKELLSSNLAIGDNTLSPKDIMILVRKRSELIPYLIKNLKEMKIPVSGADKFNLFEEIVIEDLISLANFVLLPSDDLNLACLLKSPLIGISDETLEQLCLNKNISLWSNIEQTCSTKSKYNDIFQILSAFLEIKHYKVHDFYSNILLKKNNYKKFISRLGDESIDVVTEFLNLTIEFAAKHTDNLQAFVKWFSNGNNSVKRSFSKDDDKVRILTVHGAKGLEAPVVIMPDTISLPLSKTSLLFIEEDFILWNSSLNYQNEYLKNLNQTMGEETYNEYLRLLYVALTRAKNYLIICGVNNQKKLNEKSWYNIIQQAFIPLLPVHNKEENNILILKNGSPNFIGANINKEATESIPKYFFKNISPIQNDIIRLSYSNDLTEDNEAISPYKIDYTKNFIKKGILIHKILELLPKITPQEQEDFINHFLLSHKIDYAMKLEIKNNCMKIIEKHSSSMIISSINELKVGGTIKIADKKTVLFGQIDKVILQNNIIEIFDFKSTNSNNIQFDKIESKYLKQMYIYTNFLKNIFQKEVLSSLIWTKSGEIVDISKKIVNNYELVKNLGKN